MKKPSFLVLLTVVIAALVTFAGAGLYRTLMVYQNGRLAPSDTNFFLVNSNLLNVAVAALNTGNTNGTAIASSPSILINTNLPFVLYTPNLASGVSNRWKLDATNAITFHTVTNALTYLPATNGAASGNVTSAVAPSASIVISTNLSGPVFTPSISGAFSNYVEVTATNAAVAVTNSGTANLNILGNAATATTANGISVAVSNGLYAAVIGSVSSTTFPPLSNTVFVSASYGNDATAARGRLDLPSLTISNAIRLAHASDTIFLFNGTYIQTNLNMLQSNITFVGESPEGVKLFGSSYVLDIVGDCTVESLSVTGTNGNNPINLTMTAPATSVTIRNVHFLGNQDNIVATGANPCTNVLIEACIGLSYYDCFNLQMGTVDSDTTYTIKNSTFKSIHVPGESNIQCGMRASKGTINVENCSFDSQDGFSQTSDFTISGGIVRVSNCGMVASSGNGGTVAKAIVTGGTLTFDGCAISTNDIAQSGGTISIVPQTAVGQFIGDGTGITNLSGGTVGNALFSTSPSASSPTDPELVTAGWVRNAFNVGADYFVTQVVDPVATNAIPAGQPTYTFASAIPASSSRTYTTSDYLTNGGYIGSVITTNQFMQLGGTILLDAYLGYTGGSSTPTLSVHPEIYYSYDRTNWVGDFSAGNQTILYGSTNLYQWLVQFPRTTATNATGFWVERRYKVGTVTGVGVRTLTFLIGTNSISGSSTASHITMQSPSGTSGNAFLSANQTFTGDNTFSGKLVSTNGYILPPLSVYPGPSCTNGLAIQWNSNGVVLLRYSSVGATTFSEKQLAP